MHDLQAAGYALSNRLREYTIFDSNVAVDAGWIDAPPGVGDAEGVTMTTCVARPSEPSRTDVIDAARHLLHGVLRRWSRRARRCIWCCAAG